MDFIELKELHSDKTLTPLFVKPTAITMSKMTLQDNVVYVVNLIDYSGNKYVILTRSTEVYSKIYQVLHCRTDDVYTNLVALNETELSMECDDDEEKITDISLYAIYKYNESI